MTIEGEIVKDISRKKAARTAVKQIPTVAPRRVPRLSRS